MTVTGVLNLIWALGALLALGAFALAEVRRRGADLRSRCQRALTICLTAVVLFPSVSATDDLARFEQLHLCSQARSRIASSPLEKSSPTPGVYLARLADALETLQISAVCWLLVTLCFFGLVLAAAQFGWITTPRAATGRAPPHQATLG